MFVTPRFRRFFHGKSGKKELGAYRNVEKRGNFRLQERKSNFLTTVQSSIVSNSKVRVTHKIPKKSGYYVVAEGDDLKEMRIESVSNNKLVEIVMDGNKLIHKLSIDGQLFEEDKDFFEDVVISALNESMSEVDKVVKKKMKDATGGMMPNLPGF